jgi:hypothetical protein
MPPDSGKPNCCDDLEAGDRKLLLIFGYILSVNRMSHPTIL